MKNLLDKIIQDVFKKKSVIFISFHKCATSYFAGYVLKNVSGCKHTDYLQFLYENDQEISPVIEEYGYVYGVIRLQEKGHPRYEFVQKLLSHQNFNKTKQVYFTRDPRDILVSSYYSFGFTHRISQVDDLNLYENQKRQSIQDKSIDEYVLAEAPILAEKFMLMHDLLDSSHNGIHLKYEEMIEDFDSFFRKFRQYVPVYKSIYKKFCQDTRPTPVEVPGQHKRHGIIHDYENKLKTETILQLDRILKDALNAFGYQAAANNPAPVEPVMTVRDKII